MFWGVLLLALGLSLIVEHVFAINVPLFRIFLGVFFIYLGVKTIFGGFHMGIKRHVTHNQAIFGQTQFSFHQKENKKDFESSADKEDDFEDHEEKTSKNFDTIFGSSELDLKEIALNDSDVNVKINTVFGETKVFVPQNFPLLVESSSAFAEIKLPNKNLNAFGNFTYENDAAKNAKYKIRIKANAVFGSIRFIER